MKAPYILVLALAACSAEVAVDTSPKPAKPKTIADYELPPGTRWTSLVNIWLPTNASPATRSDVLAGAFMVDDLALYPGHNLDQLALGPGESHHSYELGATAAAPGPNRRSLLYFAQFSDLHLIDEESPVRLEGVTRFIFGSAYRPQDHLTAQMVDAVIRTVNEFSFEDRPLDFAFTTGDVADNAQENEVRWVRALFDGDVVYPDSGAIDDPVPGSANDFTDPFQAAGLDPRVPWYMLFGNHDQMFLGTFDALDAVMNAAVGGQIIDLYNFDALSNGTVGFGARDASRPFAPVVRTGTKVPPDPRRRMLAPTEFMQIFVTSPTKPTGHGFTQEAVDTGMTSYAAQPASEFPLTLIAIDTVAETITDSTGNIIQHASANGEISRELWDGFVVPELDEAKKNKHLVIVASHHCTEALLPSSEVSPEEIQQTLKRYPNMLAYLCGHGHRTRAWWHAATEPTERGYPELMHASAVDFPIQARLLELVDNDNGTLSLFTTQVEPNVAPGMLAYEGLMYAAAAHNFPFVSLLPEDAWQDDKPYRNMEIVLPMPAGIDLSSYGKPAIESLTRLAQ